MPVSPSQASSILCLPTLQATAGLRWAQLHCLEPTVSIRSAGVPGGLNPWSWCLWLSGWIRTGQIGKTIKSHTRQSQNHFDSIPATPSAQFAVPCLHALVTLVEHCFCQYISFYSPKVHFTAYWNFIFFLVGGRVLYRNSGSSQFSEHCLHHSLHICFVL